jgi:hypothetical protein
MVREPLVWLGGADPAKNCVTDSSGAQRPSPDQRLSRRPLMSVPRLRRRHPREIVVLHAFGELVRAGLVAGARASLLVL